MAREALCVEERRQSDQAGVHPEQQDVALHGPVSDEVVVAERLGQRREPVHGYGRHHDDLNINHNSLNFAIQ